MNAPYPASPVSPAVDAARAQRVPVWDLLVRAGHWLLVAGFATAYVTAEESESIHVWAGYLVGTVVIVRVLWGMVGPRHARFADFVRGPREVAAYLAGLVRGGGRRYLGHNPAGGAMVVALLLSLALTVGAGLTLYAVDEGEGPLAGLVPRSHAAEDALEDFHEFAANATLGLVILHVAGVLLSSLAHRENLVRSMVIGHKRAEGKRD